MSIIFCTTLYRSSKAEKKARCNKWQGRAGWNCRYSFESVSRNEKAENIRLYLLFDIVSAQLYIVFSLHMIEIGKHCMLNLGGHLYISVNIWKIIQFTEYFLLILKHCKILSFLNFQHFNFIMTMFLFCFIYIFSHVSTTGQPHTAGMEWMLRPNQGI